MAPQVLEEFVKVGPKRLLSTLDFNFLNRVHTTMPISNRDNRKRFGKPRFDTPERVDDLSGAARNRPPLGGPDDPFGNLGDVF